MLVLMHFNIFQALVGKKCDETLPSIILAGRALLVKMPITLELCGIFCSNLVYYCIVYIDLIRAFKPFHTRLPTVL